MLFGAAEPSWEVWTHGSTVDNAPDDFQLILQGGVYNTASRGQVLDVYAEVLPRDKALRIVSSCESWLLQICACSPHP